MQMIFSGAGTGGSQVMSPSAWSGVQAGGLLGKAHELSGGDHFAQRRIVLGVACGEIDDAALQDGAVAWFHP